MLIIRLNCCIFLDCEVVLVNVQPIFSDVLLSWSWSHHWSHTCPSFLPPVLLSSAPQAVYCSKQRSQLCTAALRGPDITSSYATLPEITWRLLYSTAKKESQINLLMCTKFCTECPNWNLSPTALGNISMDSMHGIIFACGFRLKYLPTFAFGYLSQNETLMKPDWNCLHSFKDETLLFPNKTIKVSNMPQRCRGILSHSLNFTHIQISTYFYSE